MQKSTNLRCAKAAQEWSFYDHKECKSGNGLWYYQQASGKYTSRSGIRRKSNVGKSSLINGLMNRKSLARTSSQPGKTQTINYYNINDEIYFVDLPGYGYAQANEHVKAQWG